MFSIKGPAALGFAIGGGISAAPRMRSLSSRGGVDIAVSHRFSIRAVQVDYGINHLPNNANNSENLLRVSTGVAFRIR